MSVNLITDTSNTTQIIYPKIPKWTAVATLVLSVALLIFGTLAFFKVLSVAFLPFFIAGGTCLAISLISSIITCCKRRKSGNSLVIFNNEELLKVAIEKAFQIVSQTREEFTTQAYIDNIRASLGLKQMSDPKGLKSFYLPYLENISKFKEALKNAYIDIEFNEKAIQKLLISSPLITFLKDSDFIIALFALETDAQNDTLRIDLDEGSASITDLIYALVSFQETEETSSQN